MIFRVLIVDDEPWARLALRRLLEERDDVEVVAESDSLASTTKALDEHEPDLAFLDIQLRADSIFDLFEQTRVKCEVVFVTAFNDYAVRAFDVDAIDYVVKPVRREHVERAIERAMRRLKARDAAKEAPGRIYLRESGRLRAIETRRIVFIQVEDVYTCVHLDDGESVLVRKGLQAWEEELPSSFAKVHRSTIVNVDFVQSMALEAGRWCVELCGISEPLPVSRRLAKSLRARLAQAP